MSLASQVSALATRVGQEIKSVRAAIETAKRPGVIFSGVGPPPATITGAKAGDFWLNEATMELYKITGV